MKAKVLDIQGKEPCWAIGTVYCELKYKPNILEEVISDVYRAPDLTKSYTDPEGSDEIMLEDESGRVLLVGENIRVTPFITGAVIGVLGMEADAGTFQVLDICYPIPIPQKPLNLGPERSRAAGNKKIAFVSGLNISTTTPGRLLKLQLLQEYLTGNLCSAGLVSNIGKLLICGDSLSFKFDTSSSGELVNCLSTLGNFLTNVTQSISVALMPGANDPSNRSLPQKPLHKALFSQTLGAHLEEVNRDVLKLVTNPYRFHIEDLEILATAGQSINDICKYLIPNQGSSQEEDTIEHRLDLMECTMKWQNIAPTVPDTLWAYPFPDSDPFLLDEWPHVYIVGNQPGYGFRDLDVRGRKIKLVSVPVFSSTGDVVLLDLTTLETEVINIGA
ncbi:hypothetical protein HG537_0E04690 [Torulaspora globosa]|uniref:DNA-directed DNA polymerase n=1 Tax=Torulaspora globosa TaxID=48254 RepID=A0A7H9HTP6_9SACH|nr:hypothetical protein HG537_0E04690 [Torulaspora sp. CBS 2947]